MPTARELLEQADALMRRNRARAEAEAAADREAPVDDDVPELTEAMVPPPAPAHAAPPETVALAPSAREVVSLDDVPELTDAVEEIEAPSILDPSEDDELSRWLEIDRGEKSVTGPAPDSVIAVPTTLHASAAPTAGAAAAVPTPSGAWAGAAPAAAPAAAPHVSPELAPFLAPPAADAAGAPTAVEALRTAAAMAPPELSWEEARTTPIPPVTEPPPDVAQWDASPDAVVEIDIAVPAAAEEPLLAAAREFPDEPLPSLAIPAALAPLAGSDDARWAVLAEDIRMQVLQRLDIFTDTGLQGELTTRLQPIVDRASADLVAAINQHVGQILRSYVAEAIEREIEKWRQGG